MPFEQWTWAKKKAKPMAGSGWMTHPCGVTHDTQASTFHHPGVTHCVNPAPRRLAQEASGCPGPIPRLRGLVLFRPPQVSGSCGPKCKSLSPSLKCGETCEFKLRIWSWEGPGPPAGLLWCCGEGAGHSLRKCSGGPANSCRAFPKASPLHERGLQVLGRQVEG